MKLGQIFNFSHDTVFSTETSHVSFDDEYVTKKDW